MGITHLAWGGLLEQVDQSKYHQKIVNGMATGNAQSECTVHSSENIYARSI